MRLLLLLLLLSAFGTTFAQSKQKQIETLQYSNNSIQQRLDSLQSTCTELEEILKFYKLNGSYSLNEIDRLERQNKELKIVLKDYIFQIDSIKTIILIQNEPINEEPASKGIEIGEQNPFSDDQNNSNMFGNDDTNESSNVTCGGVNSCGHNRKVINNVHLNIDYAHVVHLSFIVMVDAKGNVINAKVYKNKTTTTDQVLINKVRNAIVNQVKYSKAPGASLMTRTYSLTIMPS